MLPSLRKHSLMTAALCAVLSLSACGKKKDVLTSAQTNKTEQGAPGQNTPDQNTQGGESETENTSGTLGGGLPDPNSSESGDYNPPGPLSGPETPTSPPPRVPVPPPAQTPPPAPPLPKLPAQVPASEPKAKAPTQPQPQVQPQAPVPAPPVTVDPQPVPRLGTSSLPSDYRSNDYQNVTRDNLSKRLTGGVTQDGLVYTSSATDELLTFLRARNERVNHATQRANIAAAASVMSAKMSTDPMSGDAVITLKISEGSSSKVYNVAGSLGSYMAAPLQSVRSGNGEKTTGTRALSGTVKCLDLDGGCETVFARLRIGSSGSSAIINVVFRNSSADLYFHLPGEYSDNPEYLILRDFFRNTVLSSRSDEKIKSVHMSSFEVVNGRSGFAVSMKGYNNELLAFAGPLLAPEAGTGVNIYLSRIAKEQQDSLDLISLNNTKLTYANWIGEARLVANNGLGQVRVALKMRKRGSYAQDQFSITYMRRIKPLVDITDDNLK